MNGKADSVLEEIINLRARAARAELDALDAFISAMVDRKVSEAMKKMQFGSSTETEQLLTVREAARYLGVTVQAVYVWVDKNKIPYRRLNKTLRFSRQELERWSKGEPLEASQIEAARASLRALK